MKMSKKDADLLADQWRFAMQLEEEGEVSSKTVKRYFHFMETTLSKKELRKVKKSYMHNYVIPAEKEETDERDAV